MWPCLQGKKVVLFSLPGAFTPTCSSTHLPGYEKAYAEMKALGVDEVYCLSVNDAFVMRQWGLKQVRPAQPSACVVRVNPRICEATGATRCAEVLC